MLAENERVVNESVLSHLQEIILKEFLDVSILNILARGIDCFLRDVATYYLDIDIMLLPHLLEVIELAPVFLISLLLMNWPVLKGHFAFEVSHRLIEKHHYGLYQETSRPTERVPEIKLSSILCL